VNMWSIKLKARPDGGVQVAEVSYGVPAGEIEIRGSDDGVKAVLDVRQRDPEGRFVISAHHRRDRAEEALRDAEETAEAITGAGGEAEIAVAVAGEIPG